MKAITIQEPYGSLLADHQFKHIETRSWPTKYRGLVAIHTSKRMDREQIRKVSDQAAQCGITLPDLKFGCVIAVGELVDCVKMTWEYLEELQEIEKLFGWFSIGRYSWVFENMQRIEPVAAKGQLSLWEWNGGTEFAEWPIGTPVRMVDCSEADKYKGRVWKTTSKPWMITCGIQVVRLDGYGVFNTEHLQRA